MILGLPAGMITTHDLKRNHSAKYHIVDGRQRKAALKVILNPAEFAQELQQIFTGKKAKIPINWDEKITEHVANWFSNYSYSECEEEAKEVWQSLSEHTPKSAMVSAFKGEYEKMGIELTGSRKSNLISDAATEMAKNPNLNQQHSTNIKPLSDFAAALSGIPGHSPFDELYNTFNTVINYENWNTKANPGTEIAHHLFGDQVQRVENQKLILLLYFLKWQIGLTV